MQAVRIHNHGQNSVLQVENIERPEPGAHEVLLEVAAAGVNPIDTYYREGVFQPVDLPFTPGVDCSGRVVEVGENILGFSVGDRVFCTAIGNASHQGGYAEYATVPQDRVVAVPDGVSLTEAGAAGAVTATAWRALIDYADLSPAEDCLIHGGAGGVGHVAVQIGAAVSSRVLTTAAGVYHDELRQLGADTVFDYACETLKEDIDTASAGGVDVILDHRIDDYLQLDTEVAASNARIIGIGNDRPHPQFSNARTARAKEIRYQFMSLFNTPDFRVPLRATARLLDAGKLSINIAETYRLSDAPEAHRAVAEDSFLGKLVMTP